MANDNPVTHDELTAILASYVKTSTLSAYVTQSSLTSQLAQYETTEEHNKSMDGYVKFDELHCFAPEDGDVGGDPV